MPDKISPFGKKYGTRGRFGWKRSGFTPIDLNFSEMNNKNLSKLQIERLKSIDFQRKHLYGFTTRELEELDALSDRPLRKPNLDNPIISYLDFDHWHDGGSKWGHKVEAPPFPVPKHHKTQGFLKKLKGVEKYHYSDHDSNHSNYSDNPEYPSDYDGSEEGNEKSPNPRAWWVGNNPMVRPILEPILRLASQLLLMEIFSPLFDAIFLSEWRQLPSEKIPPEELEYNTQFQSIWPLKLCPLDLQKLDHLRLEIHQQLNELLCLGMFDGIHDPLSAGGPDERLDHLWNADAYTSYVRWDPDYNNPSPIRSIWITLDYRMFEVLVFQIEELNDAEILAHQYSIAGIIVHEMSHIFIILASLRRGGDIHRPLSGSELEIAEPYWQDDAINEFGWCAERNFCGGSLDDMLGQSIKRTPMFGLWVDKLWPWKGEIKWAGLLLRESFMHEEQETFPVPVGLYEDIFQKDFWEYRRRFAATPLEMRTIRTGVKRKADSISAYMGSEEVAWQRSVSQTSILVAPPKVREAFLAAQAIIESSKKIEQYFNGSRKQRDETEKILELIQKFSNYGKQNSDVFLYTVEKMLATTADYHERNIFNTLDLILNEENHAKRSTYGKRLSKLAMFNRGIRGYISTLQTEYSSTSKRKSRLDGLYETWIRFGQAYVIFYSPGSYQNEKKQEDHVNYYKETHSEGNFHSVREGFDEMNENPRCTWWTMLRMEGLYITCVPHPEMKKKRQISCLKKVETKMNNLLKYCRRFIATPYSADPRLWRKEIKVWLKIVQNTTAQLEGRENARTDVAETTDEPNSPNPIL